MEALNYYMYAFSILWSYSKPRVLLQSDCDFIQPGLHHFIEGYMIAQYMRQQFPLPQSFTDWVEDYLKLRPNDILVEYIHVKAIVDWKTQTLSDYEHCKETIRALEIFVHKLQPYAKNQDTAKRILIDSYYVLGARYTTTDQYERALDAFENCYALDETNIAAIYSVAFHHNYKDPEKALQFCNKYLEMAPKCDEKFPNVHYLMGYIYACHFKNINLAKKSYLLGKEAETYRLPFNTPTDFDPKSFLESIMPLAATNNAMLQKTLEHMDMKKLTQL
jgi:tetratricopeptide (TPR) repeat protein